MQNMDNQESGNTHGTGITMVILAWVLILGLMAWWFADFEKSQNNPNQQIQTRTSSVGGQEIVLQRNHYGHYVATGHINGMPVTFLLDTGASDVSIPSELADTLGLERGISQVYNTANGQITAHLTRLDRISLGGIELRNVPASINPATQGDEVLLGMSFLKDLEFTQRGDTLIIRKY
ncbi:MAG: TIGR02281 family clan AA aspartic protease [Sulfuriflexus sp.]|nr:TIGR02281 family clan AA aspartic protease [Sulfuriflexus sp.]